MKSQQDYFEELKSELERNLLMQKWLSLYHKDGHESFLKTYAWAKSYGLGFEYEDPTPPRISEYQEYALKALRHIQQKKLFNLQCQWRAEIITLPHILTTYDFKIWENEEDVLKCPFLPPVSEKEMLLYLEFMHQHKGGWFWYEDDIDTEWQDYPAFKREHLGLSKRQFHTDIPDWYLFYDSRYDTGTLMSLPDIRGDKEAFYYALMHENERVNQIYTPSTHSREEMQKEYPDVFQHGMDFALTFENSTDAQKMVNFFNSQSSEESYIEIDECYEFLKSIDEPIAFLPDPDWKESLLNTVKQYKFDKVVAILPKVWKKHYREAGADHEAWISKRVANYVKVNKEDINELYNARILKGRELAGEPRDFNF